MFLMRFQTPLETGFPMPSVASAALQLAIATTPEARIEGKWYVFIENFN